MIYNEFMRKIQILLFILLIFIAVIGFGFFLKNDITNVAKRFTGLEKIPLNEIVEKIAKDVFVFMLENDRDPEEIINEKDLVHITNTSEIEDVIEKILGAHQTEVKQFLEGKEKVFGFFVGKIMKETKGKANPQIVNEILREKLNTLRN